MGKFVDYTEVINTGAAAPTNSVSVNLQDVISLYMRLTELTGNVDDCVAILQCSPDDDVWDDIAGTEVTFAVGENVKMLNNVIISSLFVRLQVTTKSTVASTATLIIQAK